MSIEVGAKLFIRTITHYYTGEVLEVGEKFWKLGDAAWIAYTDRFHQTLAKGTFDEVEPYPDDMPVFVNSEAIIDFCVWPHPLPRSPK